MQCPPTPQISEPGAHGQRGICVFRSPLCLTGLEGLHSIWENVKILSARSLSASHDLMCFIRPAVERKTERECKSARGRTSCQLSGWCVAPGAGSLGFSSPLTYGPACWDLFCYDVRTILWAAHMQKTLWSFQRTTVEAIQRDFASE